MINKQTLLKQISNIQLNWEEGHEITDKVFNQTETIETDEFDITMQICGEINYTIIEGGYMEEDQHIVESINCYVDLMEIEIHTMEVKEKKQDFKTTLEIEELIRDTLMLNNF